VFALNKYFRTHEFDVGNLHCMIRCVDNVCAVLTRAMSFQVRVGVQHVRDTANILRKISKTEVGKDAVV